MFKTKEISAAFEPWLQVYETCPAWGKAVYYYGPKILETKIDATTDPSERQQYVDLLIELYDNRLKYFPGKEGYVLSEKASKYLKYNKDSVERASQLFDASYAVAGKNMNAAQIDAYFRTNVKLYNITKDKDEDRLFSVYNNAIEALEYKSMVYNDEITNLTSKADSAELSSAEIKSLDKAKRNLPRYETVQRNIEKMLTPLLTCEKLASIYNEEKFLANQADTKWLKRAAKMLQKERAGEDGEIASCIDNPVFLLIAEQLYSLEPRKCARSMAKLGVRKNDWAMAKNYYQEAVNQEEDSRKTAEDYMHLAYVNNKMGALASAKSNCLKAGQLRKDWGNPYLLLATLYADAAGDCGTNAVEKNAVYWAAINKLNYARSLDPSISDEASKLISIYKGAVPDKGVAFQLGFKEGDSISIGCWINETVTVKFY